MSATVRKILTLISAILFVLLAVAAMPFIGGLAHAAEIRAVQPLAETVIPDPEASYEIAYGDFPLDLQSYEIVSITDGAGSDVTEQGTPKAGGEYTVTVAPAQDCKFADGSETKSFTLTVNKAHLKWTIPLPDKEDRTAAADDYPVAYDKGANRIRTVWATNDSMTYKAVEALRYNYGTDNMLVTKEGQNVTSVTDVGTYEFAVEGAENYDNPTFNLRITPKKIDIGKTDELYWIVGGSALTKSSVTLYQYSYNKSGGTTLSTAYTAVPTANPPYENWQNWQYVTAVDGAKAVMSYRDGLEYVLTLSNTTGSAGTMDAQYVEDCRAEQSGRYEAKAKISPRSNYELVYDSSTSEQTMGIVDNHDGTYTVTQVWYVAHFINSIVSQSADGGVLTSYSPEPFVTGWAFGQLPQGGITAPVLEHGDEIRMYDLAGGDAEKAARKQPSGYSLSVDGDAILFVQNDDMELFLYTDGEAWQRGEKDAIVFSLTRGGEQICSDVTRKYFNYYVNAYMPVGEYEITFSTKSVSLGVHNHWWNGEPAEGCGTFYTGTSLSFTFSVTAAEFVYDDAALKQCQTSRTALSVNIDSIADGYSEFFATAESQIRFENAVTQAVAKASGTYWGEDGVVGRYFGESALVYKLYVEEQGSTGGGYYGAGDDSWSEVIDKIGTYRIYYRITSLPNFTLPAAGDESQQYFIVHLFEELDLPELANDSAYWTGEAQTFLPKTEDSRYSISDNVQTEVGTYKAKFTLLNPEIYHWKGVEGAIYEVEYRILAPEVQSPDDQSPPTGPDTEPEPDGSGSGGGTSGNTGGRGGADAAMIVLSCMYGLLTCALIVIIVLTVLVSRRNKSK